MLGVKGAGFVRLATPIEDAGRATRVGPLEGTPIVSHSSSRLLWASVTHFSKLDLGGLQVRKTNRVWG